MEANCTFIDIIIERGKGRKRAREREIKRVRKIKKEGNSMRSR